MVDDGIYRFDEGLLIPINIGTKVIHEDTKCARNLMRVRLFFFKVDWETSKRVT